MVTPMPMVVHQYLSPLILVAAVAVLAVAVTLVAEEALVEAAGIKPRQ